MERNLKAAILWAFLAIPMHDAGRWEVEKYSKIPAHTLDFSSAGLKIQIDKSASPLFYALPSVQRVYGFKVKGEFQGLPRFLNTPKQGDKGADDYALRIGFIVPGEKKLTGLRRVLAPDWVKNLYDKIPKGLGLDRVQFFNITQNPAQLNLTRVHPLSELIQEEFIAVVAEPGAFQYEYKIKNPFDAVALWISSDGDDTQSKYQVLISNLEIKIDP